MNKANKGLKDPKDLKVNKGSEQGPEGPQGPQGEQGEQGPEGEGEGEQAPEESDSSALDPSAPVNLSNHFRDDWDPAWSPDGSRIAFVSQRDGNAEIYVMDADGRQPDPPHPTTPATTGLRLGRLMAARSPSFLTATATFDIYAIVCEWRQYDPD